MTYPSPATYTPVKGKLGYPVSVLATRQAYGRQEYQIQSPASPDTCWVTKDRLEFEEG